MANVDSDGMVRINLKWEIQGRNGTKTGTLFGLHFAEVLNAKSAIQLRARRGDTVIITEI